MFVTKFYVLMTIGGHTLDVIWGKFFPKLIAFTEPLFL